jgi:TatD DNase family protein
MTAHVDFHCHLDLYPDLDVAISEAEGASVYTLAVTTTPRAWPRNFEQTRSRKLVRAALGMHPQLIADHANELTLWDHHLPQARYIGEVGLDAGPRFYSSFDLQKKVFEHVLKACAEVGSKILTVHSVRAAKHALDLIEKNLQADRGRVVMHWFTGSAAEVRRAASIGLGRPRGR